jgi:DDE superfamily endonuclease
VIAAIESAGAIAVYLPPYSPDFNGIEAMWSKVKVIVRSIKARTAEALLDAIGVALRAVTATDAESWFAHRGDENTELLTAVDHIRTSRLLWYRSTENARSMILWPPGERTTAVASS